MKSWSWPAMRGEGQTKRFPAVQLTTNSRIYGGVSVLEKQPSRVSRAGFHNEEQRTCEDALEVGFNLSAGSRSLQLNGLLPAHQTQTQPPPPHPGILGLLGPKVKPIRSEMTENAVLRIICEQKSESEKGEDDGSVLFAEDMNISYSDSDSFYSEGLYSTDDDMEDDIVLDFEKENDKDDDSSDEDGSKKKQMGKEDGRGIDTRSTGSTCFHFSEPRSFEGPEECKNIKKPEEILGVLGDEDVVQVERGIIRNWACADFSDLSEEESEWFVTKLVDMCVAIGMEFTLSPIMETRAASTDIERTLVDLHGKINDHLTKCGRKEEQLGLLLVILPGGDCPYYEELERVCKKLGITFYHCFSCEAMRPIKGQLKRIAREIQSKVVMRDARLRRLALPLVSEAPMLVFGADIFYCSPGDEGSDYISSVATSLDWPKFRRYTVYCSHDVGTVNVSAKLGSMITEFIYSFSKITKRTVEKIIFFRNGLDGQFGDFCHQEMSAIKTARAYYLGGYEPRITYVVVVPREKVEMIDICGTGADGYKFWCRHSGGKEFSTLVCYHVHDENNFLPGELQSLTSKLCSIRDRRAYPEIDTVPPVFYARHDGEEVRDGWVRQMGETK